MKPLRIALAVSAAMLAAAAVAIAIAFTPFVQTWVIRRYLGRHPQLRTAVDSIAVGLDAADASGVRIARPGFVLTVPSVRIELPAVADAWSHRIVIRRLSSSGWTLDLRGDRSAVAAASLPPRPWSLIPSAQAGEPAIAPAQVFRIFEGLFQQLRLPADVQLDAVDLDGDILLPPASGGPAVPLHMTVSGGGLGAGREGRFLFTLRGAPPGAGPITAVEAQGTFAAAMDTARTFSRLAVALTASASGGRLPAPVQVTAQATAARSAAADEAYTLSLSGGDKILASFQADYANATHLLSGTWRLDLSDADVTPFDLGAVLPSFSASGGGRFDTDATLTRVHASGGLNVTADRLGLLHPALADLGAVRLASQFDLAQQGSQVRVDRLSASLVGAEPVADIRSLQAFTFDLSTGELKVADPSRDLFGAVLRSVPLGWAHFPGGVVLTGGGLRGDLVASARGGGLSIRSIEPLEVDGLNANVGSRTWLDSADVSAEVAFDFSPAGWQIQVGPATFRRNGVQFLTFAARAGRLAGSAQPLEFTGRVRGNLPGLAGATGFAPVPARGEVAGVFTGRFAATRSIDFKGAVEDLALAADDDPWARLAGELRADGLPDGRWKFVVPFAFERDGRKSDLTVTGTARPEDAGIVLDARAAGTYLDLRDAVALGGLAAPGSAPAGDPASEASPFWGQLRGRMVFAFNRVDVGEVTWNDLRGTIDLGSATLGLRGGQASLATGGDFTAEGRLDFDGRTAGIYRVDADLTAAGFDFGAFSRVRDAANSPTVEGQFRLDAHVTGAGRNPGELGGGLQGVARLTSKGGRFRALQADVADALKQSPALLKSAIDSVGSLFGLRGDKAADAKGLIDKQGQVVVALADRLKEIPYDQISLTVHRGADLNIVCPDFALIAPEVRLNGSGTIAYRPGLQIVDQPLSFDGQLGARGRIADLLGGLGLLTTQKDDLGYTLMTDPIHLGGTVAAVDQSAWRETLIKSAVHKAANGLLDKLLGK